MAQETTRNVLLERDSELSDLVGLIAEAAAGRGSLALIEGAPGIGKTRLLESVREKARESRFHVLSARASELDRNFPFGVLRQLFEPLLATADAASRDRLLEGAAARATLVLGEAPTPAAPSPWAQDPVLAHFHALYWLIANLTADETPAALVIDDAHWADAGSLRFLRFLLPRVEELPVLTVVAARPSEPDTDPALAALATDPSAHVIRPAVLSPAAVRAMIATELGAGGDPDFAEACRRATGGNPFLLRELLGELSSEGIRPTNDRAAVVRELKPPTVARSVLVRLARLDEEATAFARALAVLRDGSPLAQVSAQAGLSFADAEEATDRLIQAGLLDAQAPTSFAHPILRTVIYGDMSAAARAREHRRAASLLADQGGSLDAVAVHLLASEPAMDSAVVDTLRRAARGALLRGAAASAAALLERAVREPPATEDRGIVLCELASAELRVGEAAKAAEHFREGFRVSGDPGTRATWAIQHTVALQALGRDDEAFAVREEALAAVSDDRPDLAASLEASLTGTARLDLSRISWARARLERYRGLERPGDARAWHQVAGRPTSMRSRPTGPSPPSNSRRSPSGRFPLCCSPTFQGGSPRPAFSPPWRCSCWQTTFNRRGTRWTRRSRRCGGAIRLRASPSRRGGAASCSPGRGTWRKRRPMCAPAWTYRCRRGGSRSLR